MEFLAILLSLGLLMWLAFRGVSLLIVAPATALLAVALTGALPVMGAYTQIFMVNTGDFIISFFPLFLLGAIFGKLMEDSGSAETIAQWVIARLGPERAILAVVLCCALLTYGGVSLFVVAFAIYPIAASLFRDANIPKRLIPGTIALGAFTFTMSALPGSPAIQNAIPMPFFGTTSFAAPGLGIVAALVMAGLGLAWLEWRRGKAAAVGEGYGFHLDNVSAPDPLQREHAQGEGFDLAEIDPPEPARALAPAPDLPGFPLAIAPVLIVVAVNLMVIELLIPALDTSYLAEPLFGATTIEALRGLWAVIIALTLACLFLVLTNLRRFDSLRASLNSGADASVLPIFNTASLVGFGAVIAALPAFAEISDGLLALSGGNPFLSVAVSVAVLSAITGSASGGMSIALDNLGDVFVERAAATGTSLEAMHRITAVSSGVIDALPHNGAVITVLGICKLSHKQAYLDIFVTAVLAPVVALSVIIGLASLAGAF